MVCYLEEYADMFLHLSGIGIANFGGNFKSDQ